MRLIFVQRKEKRQLEYEMASISTVAKCTSSKLNEGICIYFINNINTDGRLIVGLYICKKKQKPINNGIRT